MLFQDLYDKPLTRKVNPAVSAADLSDETVRNEIEEYVFTSEIIANLYKVLLNIRTNQGSHVGIWINGYYGSGKSHFLKYASYMLSAKREYREMAFRRLYEATQPLLTATDSDDEVLMQEGVSLSEIKALQKWYVDQAEVEMVLFNIGDVHDANVKAETTFTTVFWNQFNAQRGFNSFNLALAQHLEKALADDGLYDAFLAHVKAKGYDWHKHISRFAAGKLDLALQMAQEVDPKLSIDVIRDKVKRGEVNISVEAFAQELTDYIERKANPNFRLIFFVDEMSQFIGQRPDLILQLQSLVERLTTACHSRVWIACTAQQSLEEVVTSAGGVVDPNNQVGKILGRFEVRASLQGTSPEYITQKRILEKKGEVDIELSQLYEAKKEEIDNQFYLPTIYQAYKDAHDFVAYYPFVPYQFHLIMRVLDSFVTMGYVDKQVKGNQRSLLNITFSIAKDTALCEVGEFVPFDRFFGPIFRGSMQYSGQRALSNANSAIEQIDDKRKQAFAHRVVNVLFMICNLGEQDKQSFAATSDNIATLLMTHIGDKRLTIKNDVEKVLSYLIDKSVIREIRPDASQELRIYSFYTEEESQVAQIIKAEVIDANTYSEELYKIIAKHLSFTASSNKMPYGSRTFSIGGRVNDRSIFSNNADIYVDFVTTEEDIVPYAFRNLPNHLVFYLGPQLMADDELRRDFLYYCKVQKYGQEQTLSEERIRIRRIFQDRAQALYKDVISKKLCDILNTCPIISGMNILSPAEIGTAKGAERYKTALAFILGIVYQKATYVDSPQVPKTAAELSALICRPIDESLLQVPLGLAEKEMKTFIDRSAHTVTVADALHHFSKPPYGWSDYATVFIINELVRRHLFTYHYGNNPNVSREETAQRVIKEAAKFTIEVAKAIPQEVLNEFVEAWKHIFCLLTMVGTNDESELFRFCKEGDESALCRLLKHYRQLAKKIMGCPFATTIDEAIDLMEQWSAIRDHSTFFTTVIESRDKAAKLFAHCKRINEFVADHFDRYIEVKQFIISQGDNFQFLPESQRSAITKLRVLLADPAPWDSLPAYRKMQRALEAQLKQCKATLVQTIRDAYTKVFDELDSYAHTVGVKSEAYADREQTIARLTLSTNFYALQANANDASDFFAQQMERINKAIPVTPPAPPVPPTPVVTPSDDPDAPEPPVTPEPPVVKPIVRPRKVVKLHTHTTTPMRTEADVDAYLLSLKQELMAHLSADCDIIVS